MKVRVYEFKYFAWEKGPMWVELVPHEKVRMTFGSEVEMM